MIDDFGICIKPSFPDRKADTAISFAAFNIQGMFLLL
jgi:hypothetical protein